MKLLVDIGNSRIKWATTASETLSAVHALAHQAPDFIEELQYQWQILPANPSNIAISCVSHQAILEVITQLALTLWPGIQLVVPKAQARTLGVTNAYDEPEKLGVDRWLALLAAKQLSQQPVCVVDCGTAITIDIMDASGQHLGGVISPGLTLMKKSLASGTDQLPYTDITFSVGLANHTAAAIYSGTLYAAVGLIEKMLRSQEPRFIVFLTGGDAAVIAAELAVETVVIDDLVLRGLLNYMCKQI